MSENRDVESADARQMLIYQNPDSSTDIEVRLEGETVWLTQAQMAELFQSSRTNIVEHIRNIYDEAELDEQATCRNFRQVRIEGTREVTRSIPHYNLDMIISLGYRVKSKTATQFRRWATERLKEYLVKGFTLDDQRLKNLGGGSYWRELLERIRDIRSSEKVMYRQVLDLYATSVDYDPRSAESVAFFKMVQNKLHYATHGHTAAEVIYERADTTQPFMGLTTFKGDLPVLAEVKIAKNYLTEDELQILNRLVSGYFDFAEVQAMSHNPMHMADYVEHLDKILAATGKPVLSGAGKVSHQQAVDKAISEYRKFQTQTLTTVEEDYLKAIKSIETEAKEADKQVNP
ncbi:virulence RhuM family protein [Arcanobacterium pinnipediorum]|uniref:Virulence RhuM family protein n=1 Tax=Arcanobacterium pinnipediorum TaxID=1503041 RepID=A0ABY5AIF3_9ACTO|nr:virulence RhuM family protein [Arcanobacterium pinnipediorum]USR79997.1 virulence RhuM family protein [Arcanobacterium pinnipediorum]